MYDHAAWAKAPSRIHGFDRSQSYRMSCTNWSAKQGWTPLIPVPHSFISWITRSYTDKYRTKFSASCFSMIRTKIGRPD